MKKKTLGLAITLIILVFSAIFLVGYMFQLAKASERETPLDKFEDVRSFSVNDDALSLSKRDLSNQADVIKFLRFNLGTKWPEKMPTNVSPLKILEDAKNPGLGINELHKSGITGAGVGIGLIDMPIYTGHPEYKKAIKEYKAFGESQIKGSAFGSASLSILAGKDIGVAPGANVYYAAVAADTLDVIHYYNAMLWFIELNKTLPEKNRIKVVVVPSAPDSNSELGQENPFEKNEDYWEKALTMAKEAGIIVFDNTFRNKFGSCYLDFKTPDSFKTVTPGYPEDVYKDSLSEYTLVPIGVKTVAEEYKEGEFGYQYIPKTGINFATPYAAGLVALGYQNSNKVLSFSKANKMLYDTAYVLKKGLREYRIINPAKYIEEVNK